MCQKVASATEKEQRMKQGLCLGGLQFLSHVGIEGSIPGRRRYKSNDPAVAPSRTSGCGQNRVSAGSGRREVRLGRASRATDSHLDLQDLTTHRMNE